MTRNEAEAERVLRMVSAASDARPEAADDIAAERAAVESEREAAERPAYAPGFYDLTRLTKAPNDARRVPSESDRAW